MADADANPFAAGRSSLRDTARWMVSGIVGAAALIIGTSTFSGLGTLSLDSLRFWCAIACFLAAAGLCWIPFGRAVAVLRSEVMTLKQFTEAKDGEFKTVADEVSALLGPTLPGNTDLRTFVANYRDIYRGAREAETDETKKVSAGQIIEVRYTKCRDACISQLVVIRFDRLTDAMKWPGSVILVLFLVATWAANPSKETDNACDRPHLQNVALETSPH